jgi:WD40 repeat protein
MNVIYTLDAKGWVNTVDFNDDGTLLAVGTREQAVIVWEVGDRKQLGQLNFDDAVTSVSWRKNSKQIAVALARGDGSVVRVFDWNQMQSKQLYEVSGIRGKFSPNGELLATGGGDGTVRLFTSGGVSLAEIPGHERYVHHISWTSDNRRFATASVDDKVIVWDAVIPRILKILPAKFALGVAWSPNNSRLVCGSGEELITVWDGNSYASVSDFTDSQTITGDEIEDSGPRGYVLDVGFDPKGDILAASERGSFLGGKGSVLFFPSAMFNSLNAENWLELAKKLRRRSLTNEECKEFFHQNNCQIP